MVEQLGLRTRVEIIISALFILASPNLQLNHTRSSPPINIIYIY
jgi:hypothetical protein